MKQKKIKPEIKATNFEKRVKKSLLLELHQ